MTRSPVRGVSPGLLAALVGVAGVRALALVGLADAITTGIVGLWAGDPDAARRAVALGIAAAVARAVAVWLSPWIAGRAAASVKRCARTRLALAVVDHPGAAGAGDAAALAASGLDAVDDFYVAVVPAAVSAVVIPGAVGLWILGADGVSALVIALTLPLVPVFMILIGQHTRERVDDAASALSRLADHIVELARGLPVLVGLGRVTDQTAALARIQREHRDRTAATLRVAFLSALALELVSTLSVAVVAVLLGVRLLDGSVGLEAALVALILAPECFAALRDVGTAFHAAADGRAAAERVDDLVEGSRRWRCAPRGAGFLTLDPGVPACAVGVGIRFADRAVAVGGVCLVAPVGRIVRIDGPSGAGKSTLLSLLAGTLPADARVTGELLLPPEGCRAFVPQAPRAFSRTVLEELLLFADDGRGVDARHDAALAMLREVGLDASAQASPASLSPGELRRLAVGRALLRVDAGATLLLVDEPTAHLDRAHADGIRESLLRRRHRAAIVLVSHDPATAALADDVVLIGTDDLPTAVGGDDDASVTVGAPRPLAATSTPHDARGPVRIGGRWRDRPWPWWTLSVALATATSLLGLALAGTSGWLIVRAADRPAILYLLVAIVGVRFFGLGKAVARYAERLATHRAVFAALDALRLRLWSALAARGAGDAAVLEGGAVVATLIVRLDQLRQAAPRAAAPLVAGVLGSSGVIVAAALLAPALTPLVALALVVVFAVGAPVAVWSARSAAYTRATVGVDIARSMAAMQAAAGDLRANGVASRAVGELDGLARRAERADRRLAGASSLPAALAAGVLSVAAVLVPPAAAAAGTAAAIAGVVALVLLADIEPVVGALTAFPRLREARATRRALAPILAPIEHGAGTTIVPDRLTSLEWHDLEVRRDDRTVVSGVSARVGIGQWLVLTGPSGAGKSTVLAVLLGGLAPVTGTVVAHGARGGVCVADADLGSWRRTFAWCPQDSHIFDSTVRGNLLLGRPTASDDDLAEVLGRVGLGPLLASSPDGLDARVGAGGSALSGGERQRLAVARALLVDADVLVLDEPTAHLDRPTAAALLADLHRATEDRMTVLVTHDPRDIGPRDLRLELSAAGTPVPTPADTGERIPRYAAVGIV